MKYLRRGTGHSVYLVILCCIPLWSGRALAQQPAAQSGSAKPNADKTSAEKTAADKATSDKAGASKANADKASAAPKLNADKTATDKPSHADSDKIAPERTTTDKVSADRNTADKTAADKIAPDKAATDKIRTDRPATDKTSATAPKAASATVDKVTTDRVSTAPKASTAIADKSAADKTATPPKPNTAIADKAAADKTATPPKVSAASSDKPAADKAAAAANKPADKAAAGVSKAADRPAADKVAAPKVGAPATDKPATGETPAGASAQAAASANVDKARQHFQRGIDSYRDGDLATALIEFKRAYSTAPNYRLLYNLGQVSADLRDYPAAERYLNQYLEESKNALDEGRKLAVQDELAKVRARIAYLHLTSNVEGTEILVDDVLVARAPFQAPIHVSTGRRRITGRAPGHTPVTQIIDAAGGDDVSVTLQLQPIAAAPADKPAVTQPVYRRGGTRKPLLIGLAIGAGVLAAGGVVFGYLAENDAVEYRTALQRKTSSSELKDLASGAKTYALVTDFLIGAALLTATVGTVVLMSPDIESREPTTQLRVGLGNVQLTKQF